MWISRILLFEIITDSLVFGRIAMQLAVRNSGVLLLLSCRSSVLNPASESVCFTASGCDNGMFSEIFGTLRN